MNVYQRQFILQTEQCIQITFLVQTAHVHITLPSYVFHYDSH